MRRYDLWDRFQATLSWKGALQGTARRSAIHRVDTYLLTRRVTRASSRSSRRRFSGGCSVSNIPPRCCARPAAAIRCDGCGAELFAVSRFTPLKRIDLLVRALASRGGRHAVHDRWRRRRPRIRQLVRDHGLESRVTLPGAWTRPASCRTSASCRAVVFPAFEEDYGLVTVEAFASAGRHHVPRQRRPAELVRDGQSAHLRGNAGIAGCSSGGLAADQGLPNGSGAPPPSPTTLPGRRPSSACC
jgi:glycosyltransferase involved in cell wall biosynthesis